MKYILIIGFLFLLASEKQEKPVQNEIDSLNFKSGENGGLINIELDSTVTDTIIIITED